MSNRCLYCGANCREKYCARCTFLRFSEIHKLTGRSNGWDRDRSLERGKWRRGFIAPAINTTAYLGLELPRVAKWTIKG